MKLVKTEDGRYKMLLDPKDSFTGAYNTYDGGTVYSGELIDDLISQYEKLKIAPQNSQTWAWELDDNNDIVDGVTRELVYSDSWELPPINCLCIIMNLVYEKIKNEQNQPVAQAKAHGPVGNGRFA